MSAGNPIIAMRLSRGATGLLLVLPAAVVSVLALILPMLLLAIRSVMAAEGGLGFGTYLRILSDPFYVRVLFDTLKMAATVTVICALVGWPVAFRIAYSGRRGRLMLTVLVLAPLLVSVVVRTFGWIVLLGPGGPVAQALRVIGMDPSNRGILFSDAAVVTGMVHVMLPIMIVSIVAGISRMDDSVFRAAVNLGASPLGAVMRVSLPASMPGVLAGSVIVFGLSASAFITPAVLGGARKIYMSTLIFQNNMVHLNFGFGATLALILVISTLIGVIALTFLFERVLFRGVFRAESR